MGAFIIIVGIILMVVVHEGAHFLAAKAFDMKATQAFFGFGPKIWSIQRGETEYGVKALPLGGYVRIIGMNPFEEVPPEDEGRTYRQKPFWQKSVVVLAGIGSHFVVAFLLFYGVALGWGIVELEPTITGTTPLLVGSDLVRDDDELELFVDDQLVSIDGVSLGEIRPGSVFTPEPGQTVEIVVVRDGAEVTLETSESVQPTPAAIAGIEIGDRLIAIDGNPIEDWEDFTTVAEAKPGRTATLVVERDGDTRTIETRFATRLDGTRRIGFFGVSPTAVEISPGIFGALSAAGGAVVDATAGALRGLFELVVNFGEILGAVFGQDERILDEVRPVSVIGLTQISLQRPDVAFNLGLVAWVNVFVGVLNLVPLYPLDGGHFAVATYEKIRGRSPDVRKLLPVAAAVFLFVVMLGLLGVYFDIVDPLPIPE